MRNSSISSGNLRADGSYALSAPDESAARCGELERPHIAPLTAFVRKLRGEKGIEELAPFFDPRDGGANARVLFLLEAPGPQAVRSGFVSSDNPDPTARNLKNLLQKAGIARRDIAVWNIVPWYIGARDGSKIRAATKADVLAGAAQLPRLWPLFSGLEAVALVGRKAQSARHLLHLPPDIRVFESFHMSNQVFAAQPLLAGEIELVFAEIATFLRENAAPVSGDQVSTAGISGDEK